MQGGLFSVALSLGFYPSRALPGTVVLWSPDFPRLPKGKRGHPAIRAGFDLGA